jgi:hypothetical protein
MRRRTLIGMLPGTLTAGAPAPDREREAALNRPKVPGTLSLRARRRTGAPGGKARVSEQEWRWEAAQTAIIICDMWDTHTCNLSAQRVAAMAPRMNQVVSAARSLGVMIIHAPSDTMKFYEGTPWRQRMQRAPFAPSPTPILARCPREPAEERNFPIDDTAGGCDDPVPKKFEGPPYPWTRQHPAIDIIGFDGISESGQEIYTRNYMFSRDGTSNCGYQGSKSSKNTEPFGPDCCEYVPTCESYASLAGEARRRITK